MFNPQFEKIGNILVHEEILTEEQLENALERQKTTSEKLGKLLLSMGYLSEDDLVRAYALQMGHRAVYEEDLLKAKSEDVNHQHGHCAGDY